MSITVTDAAKKRIESLLSLPENIEKAFRIEVRGGGCQGFEYNLEITDRRLPDDEIFNFGKANLKVDRTSLLYLMGAEIDWKSTITEEKFEIKNPNAISSCGCGTSFAI